MAPKALFRLLLVASLAATAGAQQPERPPASNPFGVESLAPLLESWIVAARDAAREEGVEPIPQAIRDVLSGFVPEPILDRVRWRVGAVQLLLPQNVIDFGHVQAMTLDDVVVFQDRNVALEDPKLWAHELRHVMQYAEWGVDGFAVRYLRDHSSVENDAWEFRWQFMKYAGLVPPVGAPASE